MTAAFDDDYCSGDRKIYHGELNEEVWHTRMPHLNHIDMLKELELKNI